MEDTHELIQNYFDGKKTAFTNSNYSRYSYHAQFSTTAQLQDCKVDIIPISSLIQIHVTLPIRVTREEAYKVSQELALINESMPEYAGYILNPLDGSVQLMIHADNPTDQEQLENKLSVAIKVAEEDIESIMDTLIIAKTENRRKEAACNEDSSSETSELDAKHTSLANKLLSFIGLVNNEDRIEDDFED